MKIAATMSSSTAKLPVKKPVYAQQFVTLAGEEPIPLRLWHKVDRVIPAKATGIEREDVVPGMTDPRDYLETVSTTCGERFEPEATLYRERTLIDWGDDDDICECAAALPTEGECKAKGSQLIMEKPVKTSEEA